MRARTAPVKLARTSLSRLSVIIPSYNAVGPLRTAIRSLLDAAPGAEVIVVDGASPDGSGDMVRREFPEVRLIAVENHGFAYAANRGLEAAHGEFLLLLNSDLFITRDAVEAMIARLGSDRRISSVAPVLVNEDGSRQWQFSWLYWPNFSSVKKPTAVPLLHGACMMTRREVLHEIGALDETFFLYNEEFDFCIRAHRAGFRMELLPERVVHLGGASTGQSDPRLRHEMNRGFVYLLQKHFSSTVASICAGGMELAGAVLGRVLPSADQRETWTALGAQMKRRAYAESPYPLSGRGSLCSTSDWARSHIGAPDERRATDESTASVSRPREAEARPFMRLVGG